MKSSLQNVEKKHLAVSLHPNRWGSLQCSPDLLAVFKGRKWGDRVRKGSRDGKGSGEEGGGRRRVEDGEARGRLCPQM